MQAKSEAEMSIFEGKAKGGAMTPTAQIAAIRQRANHRRPVARLRRCVVWPSAVSSLRNRNNPHSRGGRPHDGR